MLKFLRKVSFIYMADTPWIGYTDRKLYLQSGQFTSTLKESEYVGGVDLGPQGITWDGTNTPWSGITADKLYLQSGQFTSTIKDSEAIGSVDNQPRGISWDGVDTPWAGHEADKLYLQSGQFTSTLKTSEDVSAVDITLQGISWDGTNTPWIGSEASKLYLQSGQFTSTLKTSEAIGGVDTSPQGISWDGTNTPWIGITDAKLYLTSGQFTSTIKDSEYIGGVELNPTDICTNDVNSRIVIGPQVYNRSRFNTLSLGQILSPAGSVFNKSISNTIIFNQLVVNTRTFNRSVSNTITFGQVLSSAGSIFTRSRSNTLSLGQIISIYTINDESIISTASFTQNVIATRIRPVGTVYNISLSNTLTLNHYVDYTWMKATGEIYYGRVVHTIQNLSQQLLINGIYNRSFENSIVFTHNILETETVDYLLDIPRWIKASTSKYFSQVAIDNSLHYYIEGTHRKTNEQQTYIEFRLDGPSMTQISKDYYRFDVGINVLWSFNQDDVNLYTSDIIKGLLLDAMSDICIYKYGNNAYDNNSRIGTLQLKQNPVQVNNFGQVREDVRLMQGTVEGKYSLVVYLPNLVNTPILPIDLTVNSRIRNMPQYIKATINKYFEQIALEHDLHLFVEGNHRFTQDYQKSIELRLDGPHTVELSKDYLRFDIEINILWSFNQDDNTFHEPERIQGILLSAMSDICVYKYGDDGSFLGTLQLKQDNRNPVQVNNFGQVRKDVRLMQGTVEGTYSMYYSC